MLLALSDDDISQRKFYIMEYLADRYILVLLQYCVNQWMDMDWFLGNNGCKFQYLNVDFHHELAAFLCIEWKLNDKQITYYGLKVAVWCQEIDVVRL